MKTKILILGSSGMVGSAVLRKAKNKNFKILSPNRKELDLFQKKKVKKYLEKYNPDLIILCAAKVGGIHANSSYKADFIYENLLIQTNVITSAQETKIRKLVFLGSSCIYPRNTRQPIKEEYLLSGKLEKTNESYAIAKIAGIKMIEAFNEQYKSEYISLMPTNIYGINDNFHSKNSHVVPALIDKIFTAYQKNKKSVILWGTGKPLRDLLDVDDLADAIFFLVDNYKSVEAINIGSGKEISIKNLANLIAKLIGFKGKILFDKKMPDGTPRKILDISKIKKIGWEPKIKLEDGLKKTIDWYKSNLKSVKKK